MKSRLESLKEMEKQRKINRKINRKRYRIFLLIIIMFIASILVIDNKNRELLGDENVRIVSYSNNDGHKLNLLGYSYDINYDFKKVYNEVSDKLYYIIYMIKRELKRISSFLFVFHLYSFILKNSML